MKSIVLSLIMMLMTATSFASVKEKDLIGKSFCAEEGVIVSYTLKKKGVVDVKLKQPKTLDALILPEIATWRVTEEGAAQISFVAVTNYDVFTAPKLELVDPHFGYVFTECQ